MNNLIINRILEINLTLTKDYQDKIKDKISKLDYQALDLSKQVNQEENKILIHSKVRFNFQMQFQNQKIFTLPLGTLEVQNLNS